MKLKLAFFIGTIALAISACAKNESKEAAGNPPSAEQMEDSHYYDQFKFEVRNCSPAGTRWYHFADAPRFLSINGNLELVFGVDLYLFEQNKYIADFYLLKPIPERRGTAWEHVGKQTVKGSYLVKGPNITFDGMGVASPAVYNDKPGFYLKYQFMYNGQQVSGEGIIAHVQSTGARSELRKECHN